MSTRRLRVAMIGSLGAALFTAALSDAARARTHLSSVPRRAVISQQCPDADAPVASTPLTTIRAAVLCLTNQERNAQGLPSLRPSQRLGRVAQQWTQSMVRSGDFSHGSDFTLRLTAAGYNFQAAGENIAAGYTTPRSVVDGWMASPDHCRNILTPGFRDIGIGAAAAAAGAWGTAPATWTEDFGLLMRQSPASSNTAPERGCPYQS